MPPAANEILRWATPVHHFRRTATVRRRVRRQGRSRENDKLATWYISGNFDEEVFDDPYAFDVGRDPNPQMTFGPGGPHFCTGAHLARLEIEIVFEEMVKRVASFELDRHARAPAVELLQRHQADAAAAHSRLSAPPELAHGLQREVDVLGAGAEVDEADAQADLIVDESPAAR